MILIEWDILPEGMISSVCEPVILLPALQTADEFEWQGLHDNCNKWVCAQLYVLS